MTGDRDPKVTYRMSEERLDAIDALADEYGVTRSSLLRQFDAFGLESNREAVGLSARINDLRDDIKQRAGPIDDAGGFEGRVEDQLAERFENGYRAKWVRAKAESYYEEAEMLEREVPKHPDAPPIEDGEFTSIVDDVLEDLLEAQRLSDYDQRYENRFEAFAGVESGREARQYTLALLQTAVRMDQDKNELKSLPADIQRVNASDLPANADDDLPPYIDVSDVADVARRLADQGVDPDAIDPDDPSTLDQFGFASSDAGDEGDLPAGETAEPDGGAVAVDGGDHQAVQTFGGSADDQASEQAAGQQPAQDVSDLVEWAADRLFDAARNGSGVDREMAEQNIRQSVQSDRDTWQATIMDRSTLTPDDLVQRADDYLTARLDGGDPTVTAASGGVRVE